MSHCHSLVIMSPEVGTPRTGAGAQEPQGTGTHGMGTGVRRAERPGLGVQKGGCPFQEAERWRQGGTRQVSTIRETARSAFLSARVCKLRPPAGARWCQGYAGDTHMRHWRAGRRSGQNTKVGHDGQREEESHASQPPRRPLGEGGTSAVTGKVRRTWPQGEEGGMCPKEEVSGRKKHKSKGPVSHPRLQCGQRSGV